MDSLTAPDLRVIARGVVMMDFQSGDPVDHIEKALARAIAPYRALLKRIEWSGAEPDFQEDYAAACPVCRELKSPHAAHKPDCELAALIGAK